MKAYQPVACGLYDHLEIFAMRNQEIEIVLSDGAKFLDSIKTLEARKGDGEYIILKSGKEYRLDKVLSVKDILLDGTC